MSWLAFPFIFIVIAAVTSLIMKVSKDIVYGVVLLVFFLPFERIPTAEIMGYTLKPNHIIGVTLIVFWIFHRLRNKTKLIKNPISLILLLIIVTQLISIISAPLQSRAIIFFITNTFTIMLGVITIDILRRKSNLDLVEKVIFIAVWLVLGMSIWQFFGDLLNFPISWTALDLGYTKINFGFPRIHAFSKEPLLLGNYLFIPLGFLVSKFLGKEKASHAGQLLLFLIITAFILTISRGALFGLGIFILTIASFYPKKILNIKTLSSIVIIFVIAFLGVFSIIKQLGPRIEQGFIDHLLVKDYSYGDSTVSRLSNNVIAINDWKEHPINGIGVGNFGPSKTNFDLNSDHADDTVNNEYLEVLAETGIIGFGMFVILIFSILFRSIFTMRLGGKIDSDLLPLLVGLTATFVAIFAQYAFFSTLSVIHVWIAIGLLVVVQNLIIKECDEAKDND